MRIISFILFLVLLLIFPGSVRAALVDVGTSGEVLVNVLSAEDEYVLEIPQSEGVEIADISYEEAQGGSKLSLAEKSGDIILSVEDGLEERNFRVTDYPKDIVEIHERPKLEKLWIGISDGKFLIKQRGVHVETEYAIEVDSLEAKLSLSTPSGKRFISVMPRHAVDVLIQSKVLSTLKYDDNVQLVEEGGKDLNYLVNGVRYINFFDVYEHPFDVESKVSASTGEIVEVIQPPWLEVLKFLFG